LYVDSHCHIHFPELRARLPELLLDMAERQVSHALTVCVELSELDAVLETANAAPNLFASVGVHPDYEETAEPEVDELVRLARHPKVIAIGETGLDYYRLKGDLEWQRERFRRHIRAARQAGKPLIIHTRAAAADTIRILAEEGAAEVGGVMHCFTESLDVARQAIELGFFISFSGIVTFKNATALHEVAREVPLEKMLIETDSPYLAPTPYRGKTNEPAYVAFVGERIAALKGLTAAQVGATTTDNFFKLFNTISR
jgi:TatD DNase family protein